MTDILKGMGVPGGRLLLCLSDSHEIKDFGSLLILIRSFSAARKRMNTGEGNRDISLLQEELRGEYMKYEMNLHDERMLGYQQGREEGVKSSIIGMIREGMDFSLIAKITSYSIEQIQKIAQDNKLV